MPSSSSRDAVRAELQAQIDALKEEVSTLRGLQQQTSTPSPLQYKLIAAKFRKHCRVLSIVGDGRCLLYSLLQVRRAMLPTCWEADDLRQQLRTHLTAMYTDETWSDRVPPQLGENLSVSTFAERFLSQPTVHLPPDAICLWQDVIAPTTSVRLSRCTCRNLIHLTRCASLVDAMSHSQSRINTFLLLLTVRRTRRSWRETGGSTQPQSRRLTSSRRCSEHVDVNCSACSNVDPAGQGRQPSTSTSPTSHNSTLSIHVDEPDSGRRSVPPASLSPFCASSSSVLIAAGVTGIVGRVFLFLVAIGS